MNTLTVSEIWIHPVKSARGHPVHEATVDELGLVGDRRFLIVDAKGLMLTQRKLPQLTGLRPSWDGHRLELSADTRESLSVVPPSAPAHRTVAVWKDEGLLADDLGPQASQWLSAFLGQEAHLVTIGRAFARPVRPPRGREGERVSFADAAPCLAVGEASLNRLNDWIIETGAEPVPMNRFRPNIVIRGAAPFAEDGWKRIRVGEIEFRSMGPCARCIMTTTDQTTGERGTEPLRTLARFRRDTQKPTDVNFGQNWVNVSKAGSLRVGDPVTVLD